MPTDEKDSSPVEDSADFQDVAQKLGELLIRAVSVVEEYVRPLVKALEPIPPLLTRFKESGDEINEGMRGFLYLLGNRGWYIDPEFPLADTGQLFEALGVDDMETVDQILVKYYQSHLSDISKRLIGEHPRRARILRLAFNAHERGEYELSIPVFLIQANGICVEVTGREPFSQTKGKPRLAEYAEERAKERGDDMRLFPLSILLPIMFSKGDREKIEGFSLLNRHLVLHGEAVDYGDERNSLKAISFLSYVSYVMKSIKEDEALDQLNQEVAE